MDFGGDDVSVTTNLNIRIDKDIKDRTDRRCMEKRFGSF